MRALLHQNLKASYLRLEARPRAAFTLVEMLVVMGVIVVLISLVTPAVTGLQGASNVNRAVYDVAGLLGQARAYAMSNRAYVYVGIEELDSVKGGAVQPPAVGGKVAIAVIARKDGTSGYDISNISGSWPQPVTANDFLVIGKPQTFDNLHLVDLGQRPDTGNMARPPYYGTDAIDKNYNLGNAECVSATQFSYPLGTAATTTGYTFTKVIQFSPQGVARIQTADNSDTVAPWLEIGLQQARGTYAPTLQPPVTTGAVAAVQINGVTGAARIYRP